MNGYICFWNDKSLEIMADTSYQAQQRAIREFQKNTRKKVNGYDITVVLAEKEGEQIIHNPDF